MKGFPRGNSLCKGAKEECRVFFGGRDEEDEAGAGVDVAGSPGRPEKGGKPGKHRVTQSSMYFVRDLGSVLCADGLEEGVRESLEV